MSWIIIIEDVIAGLQALGPIIAQILAQIQSAPPKPKTAMADAAPIVVTFHIGKDVNGNVQVSVS